MTKVIGAFFKLLGRNMTVFAVA